jgi:MFS family permease
MSIPRLNRDVWLLGVASGLLAASFHGMMQLLKVIYWLRLGHGPEFIGILFATGAVTYTLVSLPASALGRRLGHRRMMIVGAITNVLGIAILPLTEVVPEAVQPLWPFLVQVIVAVGWATFLVNQTPGLMAFTTKENRSTAFPLKQALTGLGTFLGMLVGGMLPEAFAGLLHLTTDRPAPYGYALWVSAAVGLFSLVPLVRVSPVQEVARSRASRVSRPPFLLHLALLMVVAFLNNGAVASCRTFYSAYMDQQLALPTSLIGTISSVGLFLASLATLGSSHLARRRSNGYIMIIASLGLASSLLLMSAIGHWVPAGLGTVGMLTLSSLWIPAFEVLQMEMAHPEWRSLVAGACSMAAGSSFIVMNFAGGRIVTAVGYRPLFLTGTVLAVLSAILTGGILLPGLNRQ